MIRESEIKALVLRFAQYFLAAVIIGATTMLLFLLRESLSHSIITLIYLLPVLFITTTMGLGPGLLSGLLAFFAFNFYFLVPYYTLAVHQTQDIIALLVFFVVAVVISQLVGSSKRGLYEAMVREDELARLYEMSASLVGLNKGKEIAQVLAAHTQETFQANMVQVYMVATLDEQGYVVQMPVSSEPLIGKPNTVMPIRTPRRFLGEIRVWRSSPLSGRREEPMLRTFATQGALAFERISLSRAETRARVLEESDRMKSALLSSVSHELRTPLATIKASITSLLSEQVSWDTQARQDLLAVVDEETDYLNHLVGNLLDMSRIEAGAMKPNRQWNVLAEILDDVITRMHYALEGFQVEVDVPEELPLVPVDYTQLGQVFSNLLSNSAKYAPKGSTIHILAQLLDEKSLAVRLTNQGSAIAPEHLDRIFDKFFRVTDADKVSGTGLGLSICKGIIEAHGGAIWAENVPGGLAFVFTLPLTWSGIASPVVDSDSL